MRSKKCCIAERGTVIQRQENKMVFKIVKNKKVVHVCRVDGCLVDNGSIKCDYLFEIPGEALWLVELKGTDHIHALRQIISTAEQLKLGALGGEKRSAIVCAPAPKTTASYLKEIARLKPRFDAQGLSLPVKKNIVLEVEI